MNLSVIVAGYRKLSRLSRGGMHAIWIRAGGGKVGQGFETEPGVTFRWGGHSGIQIGSGVRLGRGVIVDVPRGGRLVIHDGVKIMHYTVIAVSESLSIGTDSQIAEHCSLRDSDHGMNPNRPIKEQSVASPTFLGDDVWIGRGSAVLRGAKVGDGAVIGANSVVRGVIDSGSISVGAPAKHIKFRSEMKQV